MNSVERHEARYQRRKAKREAKKAAYLATYDDFNRAFNRNALSKACHDAALGVAWKASVKRFRHRKMINIKRLSDKLEIGVTVHHNFICFFLIERGKVRFIMSVKFAERVVHKALCQNVLYPALTRNLIYDNMANQKGKGTHLARKRVKQFLIWHYRRYGTSGYALVFDFKGYFRHLQHSRIRSILYDTISTDGILKICDDQLHDYEKHFKEPVGLGLGSEQNQLYAIVVPNRLDHYIKEVLRIHCYVRFQDDGILIHRSKLYLEQCFKEIREICKEDGFIINEKKSGIVKLSHGFTFLKTQYKITDTGHIVMKPDPKTFTRERRKLKKQAALVASGEMTVEDVHRSYMSWHGSLIDRDSYRSLKRMDAFYKSMFKEVIPDGEREDHGADRDQEAVTQ